MDFFLSIAKLEIAILNNFQNWECWCCVREASSFLRLIAYLSFQVSLWHHQMEKYSVLLSLCAGNPPGTVLLTFDVSLLLGWIKCSINTWLTGNSFDVAVMLQSNCAAVWDYWAMQSFGWWHAGRGNCVPVAQVNAAAQLIRDSLSDNPVNSNFVKAVLGITWAGWKIWVCFEARMRSTCECRV